jgi:hypothetical protein
MYHLGMMVMKWSGDGTIIMDDVGENIGKEERLIRRKGE